MLKRGFDIVFSLLFLSFTLPFWIIIALLIKATSPGPVFYIQKRVGLKGVQFSLFKFRTMGVNTDQQGLLTTKPNETRITSFGRILRKFKIDEWPQFINVLIGSMSVVGPRPEVPYFVNLYTPDQLKVLQLKPGITDYASIKYFKENELLASSDAPEQTYIHVILPDKLNLNLEYLKNQSFLGDIEIIFQTFLKILR